MGKYDPWDEFFAALSGDELRLSLEDFEELTGVALPPSARSRPEWWSSSQYYAKWKDHGWYVRTRLGQGEIVFTREPPRRGRPRGSRARTSVVPEAQLRQSEADLILLGCVAQKQTQPAPARDLYTSPLWVKRRNYAERSGKPWMILSAEHGLLEPDRVIAPYDRYLDSQPREYRAQWSRTTADEVISAARRIDAQTIEFHAGSAYLDHGLVSTLQRAGFTVIWPLKGYRIGEQLSWYSNLRGSSTPAAANRVVPDRGTASVTITADHVLRIANDYGNGQLGESWGELPETGAFRLPEANPTAARLWLTFICSVDRARNAEALWSAGLDAWRAEPWVFDPDAVARRPFWQLAEVLRIRHLSQRHAQDGSAWRIIGESLAASDCPQSVRLAIDGGPVEAGAVLRSLGSVRTGGTKRFPLLSGPKIGPMWVRMMAYPGGSDISGMEVVPVAVDTHVQRVTEMLGLVATRKLDDRHRQDIQAVWFEGARMAGPFGGPPGIDGTAAALDPALWVLGKNGCSRCEVDGRKIAIGSICDLCALGRIEE
jgi:hypothetical protein